MPVPVTVDKVCANSMPGVFEADPVEAEAAAAAEAAVALEGVDPDAAAHA